jgi:hypothetical protein
MDATGPGMVIDRTTPKLGVRSVGQDLRRGRHGRHHQFVERRQLPAGTANQLLSVGRSSAIPWRASIWDYRDKLSSQARQA